SIEHLVVFNADQQRRLGTKIPKVRGEANLIGHILEVVTAIFGLSLMMLVVRASRRYSRLLYEQRHLAEEQGTAAVGFSKRLEAIGSATVSIAEAISSRSPLQGTFGSIADEARPVVGADYC